QDNSAAPMLVNSCVWTTPIRYILTYRMDCIAGLCCSSKTSRWLLLSRSGHRGCVGRVEPRAKPTMGPFKTCEVTMFHPARPSCGLGSSRCHHGPPEWRD